MSNAQIAIDNNPVLVDSEGQIQAWIDAYLAGSDLFPCSVLEVDEYFEFNFPTLPPITLGQIQWPCVGVTRFARAMFAVDRRALFSIIKKAWGINEPAATDTTIPTRWIPVKNDPVEISNVAATEDKVTLNMWLLPPIRVSDDCWILRLVDWRYFCLSTCPNTMLRPDSWTKPDVQWTDLIDYWESLPDYEISHSIITVDQITNPHLMFYTKTQTPVSYLIDSACMSLGSRPVVLMENTTGNTVNIVCEKHGPATTKKTTLLEKDRVTGGTSNTALKPKGMHVETLRAESFYAPIRTGALRKSHSYDLSFGGFANSLYFKMLYVVHHVYSSSTMHTADFEAYCEFIKDEILPWHEEYIVTLPGLVKLVPSGHDDWILYDSQKGVTVVKSMPIDFNPAYLLGVLPCNSSSLNAGANAYYWHTERDSVLAKVTSAMSAGGKDNTSGLRKISAGSCQIMDVGIHIDGTYTFGIATVTAVNPQKTPVPFGSIVHLVWQSNVLLTSGVATTYEGWVIDWVDC